MGFLEKIFGGGKKYPALTAETNAAKELAAMRAPLEELSKKVNETMEVIPADDSAFVFIGDPPNNFGMAWVEKGKVYNLKTLSEERGFPEKEIFRLVGALADVYKRSNSYDRYSTTIGGKVVTVTPSQDMAKEVKDIIANA